MRALLPLLLLGVRADEDLTTCTNALATVTAMDDECAGAGTFSSCTGDNATYATYTMTQRMMEYGLSVPSNVIAEPDTCLGAVQRLIMFYHYHYCDCDQTCAGSGSCVYNTCSGDCTDNCDLSSFLRLRHRRMPECRRRVPRQPRRHGDGLTAVRKR